MQIKETELRLTNIVMCGQVPAFILEITCNGITYDAIDGNIVCELCKWDNVTPIPITEKWLLQLGYENSHDKWFRKAYFTDVEMASEKFFISINLNSKRCGIYEDENQQTSIFTGVIVEYVHQIQNLYFALAGNN